MTNRYRIRATITEKRTDKPLKNIPVKILPYSREVETDKLGRILLNVPKGSYTLLIDYYPFDKVEVPLKIEADTSLKISLNSPFGSQYIESVELVSTKPVTDYHSSTEQLDKNLMDRLPSLIGEKDLLKTLALTSGVTSSSEGSSDIQVRGGTHGQNLYLLDEVPLYTTQHLFGLISVYNPSAIKDAELYKGAFPARFGGKLSSVLDVKTIDADLKKFKGNAEIGLLASKAALHVPIIKDKLGIFVSGRISNYSLLGLILPNLLGETSLKTFFSDLNMNLTWKPTEKDQLKLTWFSNRDGWDLSQLDFNQIISVQLQNSQRNLGLNWSRIINEKMQNELRIFRDGSQFLFENGSRIKSTNISTSANTTTAIASTVLSDRFQLKCNDRLSVDAGGSFSHFSITPFTKFRYDSINSISIKPSSEYYTEASLYAEANYLLHKNHNLSGGLRLASSFNDKTYTFIEPRIRYHAILPHNISLSASASKMSQPLHRIANAGLGFPMELYLPVSSKLAPQEAWIWTMGGGKVFNFKGMTFNMKADLWYKKMNNIIDFKDGYDALNILMYQKDFMKRTDEFVTQGSGKAYGIDFSARLSYTGFTLSGDYTLMKATNQYEDLNKGKPFAAPTDIRHSLSISGSLKLSDNLLLTANWQYLSGKPITIPNHIIQMPDQVFPGNVYNYNDDYIFLTTERANFRTKSFHKLDVSLMKNFRLFNRYQSSLTLGVYNAYNRKNPYLYFIQNSELLAGEKPELKMLSLFPVIPSVSLSVKF
jgi:hypothetical protein